MKNLSLQQAMLGMRIVQFEMGLIIKSPAGSAEYDLKGRRTKVNGYPEYFPEHLRIKDKRKPKLSSVIVTNTGMEVYRADNSSALCIGDQPNWGYKVEQQNRIVDPSTIIDEAKKPEPNLPFKVKADKIAIVGAAVGANAIAKEMLERKEVTQISEAPTIQQATLQNVLSNSLHTVSANKAGDVAVLLARAVKSAFDTLGSGSVSDQYTDRINELSAQVSQLQVAVSHARTR